MLTLWHPPCYLDYQEIDKVNFVALTMTRRLKMKKFFLVILAVALIAVVALPSVGYSGHGGYYGGHYYNNHYNNNWVPAAIGGFLFGTLVGSAIAPPVYYAPPPPPPPRVYYYYPPPRPRVYVYPY